MSPDPTFRPGATQAHGQSPGPQFRTVQPQSSSRVVIASIAAVVLVGFIVAMVVIYRPGVHPQSTSSPQEANTLPAEPTQRAPLTSVDSRQTTPPKTPSNPENIRVQSSPGAKVYFDDRFKGEVNQQGELTFGEPNSGSHNLRVSLAEKKDYVQRVTVEKGHLTTFNVALVDAQQPPHASRSAEVPPVSGVVGGVQAGQTPGISDGELHSIAPPPPPLARPAPPKRIRVGGQAESARLIFQPKPSYPPLAKMARIQGTVRLDAVIAKDGTILDLKVMSGHPLLVKAALDAVQRWRYQPMLLNGDPVEVATEIDVNFELKE